MSDRVANSQPHCCPWRRARGVLAAVLLGLLPASVRATPVPPPSGQSFTLTASLSNGDLLSGSFVFSNGAATAVSLVVTNPADVRIEAFSSSNEIIGSNVSGLILNDPNNGDAASLTFSNYLGSAPTIALSPAFSGVWLGTQFAGVVSGSVSTGLTLSPPGAAQPSPIPDPRTTDSRAAGAGRAGSRRRAVSPCRSPPIPPRRVRRVIRPHVAPQTRRPAMTSLAPPGRPRAAPSTRRALAVALTLALTLTSVHAKADDGGDGGDGGDKGYSYTGDTQSSFSPERTFNMDAALGNGDRITGSFQFNTQTQTADGVSLYVRDSEGRTLDAYTSVDQIRGSTASGLILNNPQNNDAVSLSFGSYLTAGGVGGQLTLVAQNSGAWVGGGFANVTSGGATLASASAASPAPMPPMGSTATGLLALLGGAALLLKRRGVSL